LQSAPPTHKVGARRATAAGSAGPLDVGAGTLVSHAQWNPGMACGAKIGSVAKASAGVGGVGVGGDVVRVPGKVSGVSTTALNEGARTVTTAGVDLGGFDVLGGAVHVQVLRAPSLSTSMSAGEAGEVRYLPAVVEVSGAGIASKKLDTAGDEVEVVLDDAGGRQDGGNSADDGRASSAEADGTADLGKASGPAALSGAGSGQSASAEVVRSGVEPARASDIGGAGKVKSGSAGLSGGAPLPLPTVPGLPTLPASKESAQVSGPGTRVRITLGSVRQATKGHSIAARVTAIKVAVTHSPAQPGYGKVAAGDARDQRGYGTGGAGVVLDMDLGVLETAAVAPAAGGAGVEGETAGGGGGLPITGPDLESLALAGGGLLLAGAGLAFGTRRRRARG
jgi:LPXTG-motif cell wall-anchored protein